MTRETIINEINTDIDLINAALDWGNEYKSETFPAGTLKNWRRDLKKMRKSLTDKCSAAAYGESQVGKSYLMSNLLSSSDKPLTLRCNGKDYDFQTEINSSASTNAEVEATGIITRFTLQTPEKGSNERIRIRNLTVIDLILLLIDSYYNDIKITSGTELDKSDIDEALRNLTDLWADKNYTQNIISEDDIWEIRDYVKEVLGTKASAIRDSRFAETIAPVIKYIPIGKWIQIFELLWNKNSEISRLFSTLLGAYERIGFQENVYIPFDAVLWENGTILKVQWLDTVCSEGVDMGKDILTTDIYDEKGNILARDFPKGELSALIAEVVFEVPSQLAETRGFLKEMDLLDFPGARSRAGVREEDMETVISKILRRGKVAYLFNKYSRNYQISSVLFCHHQNQKASENIGDTINEWVKYSIGENPAQRTKTMEENQGIPPLFLIATKFNKDLDRLPVDKNNRLDLLDNHWERFNKVIPEIIEPASWLEKWNVSPSGSIVPFRNIYPLRDYAYSGSLFGGYEKGASPETSILCPSDFPDYLEKLGNSFVNNKFVRKHFADPEQSWKDFASINKDGTEPIIKSLSKISGTLEYSRLRRYNDKINEIKGYLKEELNRHYEPDDPQARNNKVKRNAGDIRQDLTRMISRDPVAFGKIIEKFMVGPEELRNIAFAIIIRHTETPSQFSPSDWLRANTSIDLNDPREVNIEKLKEHFGFTSDQALKEYLSEVGVDLDEALSNQRRTLTTVAEIVTRRIVDHWKAHLDDIVGELRNEMPHAGVIVEMLKALFTRLGMIERMDKRIANYITLFDEDEQPNVIGDYAALTLNRFVSSVGREFIDDAEIQVLNEKAQLCNLKVDFSSEGWEATRKPQPLESTLEVFDRYAEIINNPRMDMNMLNKLPFWSNYRRWENFLMIGLLFSSDVSNVDPVSNKKMKKIIDQLDSIY